MGFFLSKTWPFWLLAALLAALIAWLLCRWWARRLGVAADGAASHQLSTSQALLKARESELERLAAQRNSHLEELGVLRPKAAAHDELTTQLEGLRSGSVPLDEHNSRVDELNSQVSSLTGRLHETQGQASQVGGLRARIAELEGQASQVGGLRARIAELEGNAAQAPDLHGRIAELEGQLSAKESAKPDVALGSRLLGFPVAEDDLTVVEGIGPKIAGLCHEVGIRTWRQLAQAPVSQLQEMLANAGPRYQIHDPGTWPNQAGLLADGQWERFKTLTDQLKGGRAAE